jgi:signal transduction histidine kinase
MKIDSQHNSIRSSGGGGGWREARRDAAREAALRRQVERGREAERKYALLLEREQMRDDLTRLMIHDLRTPLTSLLSGLQAAEILSDLSPAQQECLSTAVAGGQTLLRMVNDLLDLSRAESAGLLLERAQVCVPDLIAGAVTQVAPLAQEKSLHLCVGIAPSLPTMWGDEEKLRRALVNLLANAIKFTPPGGSVCAAAQFVARPERSDAFVLSVNDSGEGIPPDSLEMIFEKFGQVETRRAGRSGSTGLGLSFCKMVAQAHGGRIWAESEVGRGSTFALAIPAGVA